MKSRKIKCCLSEQSGLLPSQSMPGNRSGFLKYVCGIIALFLETKPERSFDDRSSNLELDPCHHDQLMTSRDPHPRSFLFGANGSCSCSTATVWFLTYCDNLSLLMCSSTMSFKWRYSSVVCSSSSWNRQYLSLLRCRSVGLFLGGF